MKQGVLIKDDYLTKYLKLLGQISIFKTAKANRKYKLIKATKTIITTKSAQST